MLLRQCVLAFSALTATACLTLFDAKASLAATFYNFQLNFNDGTTGNGSFSIDEAAPSYSETSASNGGAYDFKRWDNFLDFSFTYAGTTYGKSALSRSYYYAFTVPTTSNYYSSYGDGYKGFEFELSGFYAYIFDYAPNSIFADYFYGYKYSSGTYKNLTSGSWQQVPASQIPTPALLPGLIGMGVVALRKRKKESVAESVDEPIAV